RDGVGRSSRLLGTDSELRNVVHRDAVDRGEVTTDVEGHRRRVDRPDALDAVRLRDPGGVGRPSYAERREPSDVDVVDVPEMPASDDLAVGEADRLHVTVPMNVP